MSKPIIEITGLGKSYRIGANREKYLSLRDEMAKKAHGFYRRFLSRHLHVPKDEEFWALKDVSFTVNEGEAVGIIGRNGAGKSTLLKILSRITPPASGKIILRGRIASLLEVGTGFHPELTGRENIYLNGAVLGMTRAEIKRKFDEIVAFAEVDQFLDTPVKRYSSGMYVRLAFAVAAHLEPEILVVDEVLAVGDAQFQKKCLGKMSDVAKQGRTVLFVSHNMAATLQICKRGIVLVSGCAVYEGTAEASIAYYIGTTASRNGKAVLTPPSTSAGFMNPHFTSCELSGSNNQPKDHFYTGELMRLQIHVAFPSPQQTCVISFVVKSLARGYVYHIMTRDAGLTLCDLTGNWVLTAIFPKLALYPGDYIVDDLWMGTGRGEPLDVRKDVLVFTVLQGGPFVSRELSTYAAIAHEVPQWTVEHSTEA
jgi:lipopolysaccharide transport system ATP-binding protein